MGDTTTILVDENWQEFFSTISESFSFSNQGPSEVYVRESVTEPLASETGYSYMPSDGGIGRVDANGFWIRTKSGTSQFHFGTVEIESDGATFLVEEFTGATKNLVVGDNKKFIVMNSASPQVVNIPDNSAEPFAIGAEIEFLRKGVGSVTFDAPGTATLDSKLSLVAIGAQFSAAALKKIAIDEWVLFGDLE